MLSRGKGPSTSSLTARTGPKNPSQPHLLSTQHQSSTKSIAQSQSSLSQAKASLGDLTSGSENDDDYENEEDDGQDSVLTHSDDDDDGDVDEDDDHVKDEEEMARRARRSAGRPAEDGGGGGGGPRRLRTPDPIDLLGHGKTSEEAVEERRRWLARKNAEQNQRLDKIQHRVETLMLRYEHGDEGAELGAKERRADLEEQLVGTIASGGNMDDFEDLERQTAEDRFFAMYISKYKVDSLLKNYGRISDTRQQMLGSLDQWMETHVERGADVYELSDEEDEQAEQARLEAVSGTLNTLESSMVTQSSRLKAIVSHIVESCSEKVKALQPVVKQDNIIRYKKEVADSKREAETMRKELLKSRQDFAAVVAANKALEADVQERTKEFSLRKRRLTLDMQRAIDRETAMRQQLADVEKVHLEAIEQARANVARKNEDIQNLQMLLNRVKEQASKPSDSKQADSIRALFVEAAAADQQQLLQQQQQQQQQQLNQQNQQNQPQSSHHDSLLVYERYPLAPGITLEFPVDASVPYLKTVWANMERQLDNFKGYLFKEQEFAKSLYTEDKRRAEAMLRDEYEANIFDLETKIKRAKESLDEFKASAKSSYENMFKDFSNASRTQESELQRLKSENASLVNEIRSFKANPEMELLLAKREQKVQIDDRIREAQQRLRGLAITEGDRADPGLISSLEAELEQLIAQGSEVEMEISQLHQSPAAREFRRLADEKSALEVKVRDLEGQLHFANALRLEELAAAEARKKEAQSEASADSPKSKKGSKSHRAPSKAGSVVSTSSLTRQGSGYFGKSDAASGGGGELASSLNSKRKNLRAGSVTSKSLARNDSEDDVGGQGHGHARGGGGGGGGGGASDLSSQVLVLESELASVVEDCRRLEEEVEQQKVMRNAQTRALTEDHRIRVAELEEKLKAAQQQAQASAGPYGGSAGYFASQLEDELKMSRMELRNTEIELEEARALAKIQRAEAVKQYEELAEKYNKTLDKLDEALDRESTEILRLKEDNSALINEIGMLNQRLSAYRSRGTMPGAHGLDPAQAREIATTQHRLRLEEAQNRRLAKEVQGYMLSEKILVAKLRLATLGFLAPDEQSGGPPRLILAAMHKPPQDGPASAPTTIVTTTSTKTTTTTTTVVPAAPEVGQQEPPSEGEKVVPDDGVPGEMDAETAVEVNALLASIREWTAAAKEVMEFDPEDIVIPKAPTPSDGALSAARPLSSSSSSVRPPSAVKPADRRPSRADSLQGKAMSPLPVSGKESSGQLQRPPSSASAENRQGLEQRRIRATSSASASAGATGSRLRRPSDNAFAGVEANNDELFVVVDDLPGASASAPPLRAAAPAPETAVTQSWSSSPLVEDSRALREMLDARDRQLNLTRASLEKLQSRNAELEEHIRKVEADYFALTSRDPESSPTPIVSRPSTRDGRTRPGTRSAPRSIFGESRPPVADAAVLTDPVTFGELVSVVSAPDLSLSSSAAAVAGPAAQKVVAGASPPPSRATLSSSHRQKRPPQAEVKGEGVKEEKEEEEDGDGEELAQLQAKIEDLERLVRTLESQNTSAALVAAARHGIETLGDTQVTALVEEMGTELARKDAMLVAKDDEIASLSAAARARNGELSVLRLREDAVPGNEVEVLSTTLAAAKAANSALMAEYEACRQELRDSEKDREALRRRLARAVRKKHILTAELLKAGGAAATATSSTFAIAGERTVDPDAPIVTLPQGAIIGTRGSHVVAMPYSKTDDDDDHHLGASSPAPAGEIFTKDLSEAKVAEPGQGPGARPDPAPSAPFVAHAVMLSAPTQGGGSAGPGADAAAPGPRRAAVASFDAETMTVPQFIRELSGARTQLSTQSAESLRENALEMIETVLSLHSANEALLREKQEERSRSIAKDHEVAYLEAVLREMMNSNVHITYK